MSYYFPHKHTRFTVVPDWLMRRPELGVTAKVVWGKISFYCRYGCHTAVTIDRLATDIACAERTIRRAITELKEAGLIEVQQPGLNQPNEYWMLLHEWMDDLPEDAFSGDEDDVQAGPVKMTTPAYRTGQNDHSGPVDMTGPSLYQQEVLELHTSRGARRAEKAKGSTFGNQEGDQVTDIGAAVEEPPRRRRSEAPPGGVQAASVTPLHKPTSAVGLVAEFHRRLNEVRPNAGATLSKATLGRSIRGWLDSGWDPVVIRKMIDVYFTRRDQVKAAKDPIRRFVFERAELYDTATKKLRETDVTVYTQEATDAWAYQPTAAGQTWGL